jgi:hypothetical protein
MLFSFRDQRLLAGSSSAPRRGQSLEPGVVFDLLDLSGATAPFAPRPSGSSACGTCSRPPRDPEPGHLRQFGGALQRLRNPALPRVTASAGAVFDDEAALLAGWQARFDPKTEVLFRATSPAGDRPDRGRGDRPWPPLAASIVWRQRGSAAAAFDASFGAPLRGRGRIVPPGWMAELPDDDGFVLPANHAFQAFFVPA